MLIGNWCRFTIIKHVVRVLPILKLQIPVNRFLYLIAEPNHHLSPLIYSAIIINSRRRLSIDWNHQSLNMHSKLEVETKNFPIPFPYRRRHDYDDFLNCRLTSKWIIKFCCCCCLIPYCHELEKVTLNGWMNGHWEDKIRSDSLKVN